MQLFFQLLFIIFVHNFSLQILYLSFFHILSSKRIIITFAHNLGWKILFTNFNQSFWVQIHFTFYHNFSYILFKISPQLLFYFYIFHNFFSQYYFTDRHEKDTDVQKRTGEIFEDWRTFLSILPRFLRIIESLATVIWNIIQ